MEPRIETAVRRYEVAELSTATVVAQFTNSQGHTPAPQSTNLGKGSALYLAAESSPSTIAPLMSYIYKATGIQHPASSIQHPARTKDS